MKSTKKAGQMAQSVWDRNSADLSTTKCNQCGERGGMTPAGFMHKYRSNCRGPK